MWGIINGDYSCAQSSLLWSRKADMSPYFFPLPSGFLNMREMVGSCGVLYLEAAEPILNPSLKNPLHHSPDTTIHAQ
jgi:hypothetical protein